MTHGSTRCLLGVAAVAALLAGCGAEPGPAAKESKPAPPATSAAPTSAAPTKAYTIEQLGTELGCTPKTQGKAKDFRQATCPVDGEIIHLLQFDKAEGQRDWLEYATLYGGIYLSGDRWVLSGKSKEYMEGLQRKLGGKIEERDSG